MDIRGITLGRFDADQLDSDGGHRRRSTAVDNDKLVPFHLAIVVAVALPILDSPRRDDVLLLAGGLLGDVHFDTS